MHEKDQEGKILSAREAVRLSGGEESLDLRIRNAVKEGSVTASPYGVLCG